MGAPPSLHKHFLCGHTVLSFFKLAYTRDPAGGSRRTEDQVLALVLMSYVSSGKSLIPSEHDDPRPYL